MHGLSRWWSLSLSALAGLACAPSVPVPGDSTGSTGSSGPGVEPSSSSAVADSTGSGGSTAGSSTEGSGSTGEPPMVCEPGCAMELVPGWTYTSGEARSLLGLTPRADGSAVVVELAASRPGMPRPLTLTTLAADGTPQPGPVVRDDCPSCSGPAFVTQTAMDGRVRVALLAPLGMSSDVEAFVAQIDPAAGAPAWTDTWIIAGDAGVSPPFGPMLALSDGDSVFPVVAGAGTLELAHHDAAGLRTAVGPFPTASSIFATSLVPATLVPGTLVMGHASPEDHELGLMRLFDPADLTRVAELPLPAAPLGLAPLSDGGWVTIHAEELGGNDEAVHIDARDPAGDPTWTQSFMVNNNVSRYAGALLLGDGSLIVWIRHSYQFTGGMQSVPIVISTYAGVSAEGDLLWTIELDDGDVSWPGRTPHVVRSADGLMLVGDTDLGLGARVRSYSAECVCR